MDPTDDGRHGFDFYFGRWHITNRRLRRRLAGATDWDTFDAVGECHPVLGGLGNVDSFSAARCHDGLPLEGMTVRLFNPTRRQWSIYWADDRAGALQPPVVGGWGDGEGRFEGDDLLDGRVIRVRFVWTAGPTPTWQQAFSPDGGQSWEVNWFMTMTRLAG